MTAQVVPEPVAQTALLMGNEAIARGAMEAGVHFATGYPGTPSSEVIGTLLAEANKRNMRVEWATNEKVAFELAAGVASTGLRALVTMKSAGLNVAVDALVSIAYSGVDGGLVIYVADDPSCHSGMEEQDSRYYASLSLLPMLELSNPQEAKDATIMAFALSEQLHLPILLRSTTRVAHSSAIVKLGPIQNLTRKPSFTKDIRRHTRASPLWCNEQHTRLINSVQESKPDFEKSSLNELIMTGREEYGVIATGIAWNYLKEEVEKFELTNLALLKVGTVNPLPDGLIRSLLTNRKAVLVLEELEPYVELNVRAIASTLPTRTVIHGKYDATTQRVGEFTHEIVRKALGELIKRDLTPHQAQTEEKREIPVVPVRSLLFCAGCPHMGTYLAINRALSRLRLGKDGAIVTGDIGCTILGMNKPFETCWTETCMGASISMAAGFKYAGIEKPVIATIGDSTFFHAGLPALANLAITNTKVVVIVLDNRVTAMTGQQPSPSTSHPGNDDEPAIKIEEVARAMGIQFIRVVDPLYFEKLTDAIADAIKFEGPSVVVSRRTCALEARKQGIIPKVGSIDPEKCTGCLACVKLLGCPALEVEANGKVVIDDQQCQGCTLCGGLCPYHAMTGEWSY